MTTTTKRSRGRPSRFDRQQVVEQVMQLFWQHGYENLSFNEIANATGLTRASLYNAFESKEALLLEAIQHYSAKAPASLFESLPEDAPVLPVIYQVMADSAMWLYGSEKAPQKGCLVVNCMNDMMAKDNTLGREFRNMHIALGEQFRTLLQRAVANGELARDFDVDMSAKMISAFVSGMSVYSKQGTPEAELRDMWFTFLQQLGLPQPPKLTT